MASVYPVWGSLRTEAPISRTPERKTSQEDVLQLCRPFSLPQASGQGRHQHRKRPRQPVCHAHEDGVRQEAFSFYFSSPCQHQLMGRLKEEKESFQAAKGSGCPRAGLPSWRLCRLGGCGGCLELRQVPGGNSSEVAAADSPKKASSNEFRLPWSAACSLPHTLRNINGYDLTKRTL